MVRAALLALAAGALLGALMLAAAGSGAGEILRWRPLHAELLVVGWVIQLALGVAWWILPRYRHGPERGPEAPAWLAFVLLDAGVLLAGAGRSVPGLEAAALAGRTAEVAAVGVMAALAWPRVKPFR